MSLGKVGLAVAPSDPNRVYAIVDAKAGGLYRSDDAGATWKLADKDVRLWGRGWYFGHVAVDPKNPDLVYVSDTAFYRSTDGGTSFTAIKGSPDGDDFQGIWIDPSDGSRHDHRQRPRRNASASTLRRRGARGSTSRRDSSTTCAPTTRFRTICSARSRTAAPR